METEFILYRGADRYSLDLTDDVIVALNFNIEDIFDVAKRKTDYSKTINLPGTKNNNKAFNHIYMVNVASSFNPNVECRCILKSHGLIMFEGVFCLDDVNMKLVNGITDISYSCTVIGSSYSIANSLGKLTVRDLDFSDYNHNFTIERIQKSWINNITIGGVAGQANKTTTYTSPAVTNVSTVTISGKVYFKITFASAHAFVAGDEVYHEPGVGLGYDKYCFDQTIQSVISTTEVTYYCYEPTPSGYGQVGGTVKKQQLSGIGYWYPCVNYGTTIMNYYANGFLNGTGLLTVGQTYIIKSYNTGDDFTNVGAASNTDGVIFVATGTSPTLWTSPSVLISLTAATSNAVLQSKWGSDTTTTYGATDNYWEASDFITHIFLREILEKIFVLLGYTWSCSVFDSKLFRRLIIPLQQTFNVAEGGAIVINDWLPDIKLIDILSTVINIFNLSMVPNKTKSTELVFVNRGSFFDNPTIDWVIDAGQSLNIKLMNRDFPNIYNFKHKDSSDFFNTDYNSDWGFFGGRYGGYVKDLSSDFLTAENKIETIFEPSVLTDGTTVSAATDMRMATCYNADEGTGENIKRAISNRILIAGMRDVNGGFSLISDSTPADNLILPTYYPYAGHIDNYYQPHPTHDINWSKPDAVYFSGGEFADVDYDENALYKKYWRKYIDQISSPDTRIISGTFKLKPMDIYKLDFTVPIRVGGYVLRLNKIKGWNINGDGLTECEFLTRAI